jgi:hypothetical protein
MPKDQPHYQARLLNILGRYTFERVRDFIECTDEEIIKGELYDKLK